MHQYLVRILFLFLLVFSAPVFAQQLDWNDDTPSATCNGATDTLIMRRSNAPSAGSYYAVPCDEFGGGGSPAGSEGSVQFNQSSALAGSSNFVYNSAGSLILTGTSSSLLSVGTTSTNPAWLVDGSVTNAVTGITLTPAAANGRVTLQARTPSASAAFRISSFGNGDLELRTPTSSTGAVSMYSGGTLKFDVQNNLNWSGNPTGINTVTPTGALQVNASSAGNKAVVVRGFSGQTANLEEWQDSSGSIMAAISSAGNFGIGTSTPVAKFDITSSGSGTIAHMGRSTGGGYFNSQGDHSLMMGAGVEYNGSAYIARDTTASWVSLNQGDIYFGADASLTDGSTYTPTTRMLILDNGNIGIGNAFVPNYSLDIRPSTGSASLKLGNGLYLTSSVSGSAYMGAGGVLASDASAWVAQYASPVLFGAFNGDIRLFLDSGATPGSNYTPTEKFTILNAGRVGILDSTPSAFLEVLSNSTATPVTIFRGANGQTANLTEWQNTSGTIVANMSSAGNLFVTDQAYGSSWNASSAVPTKNAVYDKIETLGSSREQCFRLSDLGTNATTGTNKAGTTFLKQAATISAVRAFADVAPSGSTAIIDINEAGSTILSTRITLDAGEKTSGTAATAAVISDTSIAANAEITFDIDQVGSGTAGQGYVACIEYTY